MAKRKIVWQHSQLMAVARRAYVIRTDPLFTGVDVAAVRQAQKEVLSADMHRPIRSMQEVPSIIHIWKELRKQNYTEERRIEQPIRMSPQPETRAVPLVEESTANLMSELITLLSYALDEGRIRRLVREEAGRVLEARLPDCVPPAVAEAKTGDSRCQ